MPQQLTPEELQKALFTNLVMMLGSSAMQQLGKLVNPVTNKTEVNLDGAQITIDMIEMLKEKTKGNLDSDEDKLINDLLSQLQMNYVETAKSAPRTDHSESPESDEKAEEKAEGEPPKASGKGGDDSESEKKDPKFHKSYGE